MEFATQVKEDVRWGRWFFQQFLVFSKTYLQLK
jgi:hypothetical protein